jgi:hypothetical protein
MKKRLQIVMSDEAWNAVESLTAEANQNFDVGSISYSDVISEMILTARVDVKALQLKHTDLRRSLRAMASKDALDIDSVIKNLMELKAKSGKRSPKNASVAEEAV